MPPNLPTERQLVKIMTYKESFPLRLHILFDDMEEEEGTLDHKVSHVFDTALNGIFSAAVSSHAIDLDHLREPMRTSVKNNRITIEDAKQFILVLKTRIVETYGPLSIPIMVSLWRERAKHIDEALDIGLKPWTPFTSMELSVNREKQ